MLTNGHTAAELPRASLRNFRGGNRILVLKNATHRVFSLGSCLSLVSWNLLLIGKFHRRIVRFRIESRILRKIMEESKEKQCESHTFFGKLAKNPCIARWSGIFYCTKIFRREAPSLGFAVVCRTGLDTAYASILNLTILRRNLRGRFAPGTKSSHQTNVGAFVIPL